MNGLGFRISITILCLSVCHRLCNPVLAHKIVHGNQEDKDKYLNYLKAGNSDYPLNVITKAGLDMTGADL